MHLKSMRAAVLLGAAVFASIGPAASAEKSEEVAAAYARFAEFLKTQQAFSVDLTLEYTISVDDMSEWGVTEYSLTFVRPNRLALHVKDKRVEAQLFHDGLNVITYIPALNQYTIEPARSGPFELVMLSSVGPVTDAMVIFGQIVLDEPFESPLKNAFNTTYSGEVELAGELYEKVNIDLDAVSWDAWISKSDPPLLHRVVPKLPVVELEFSEHSGKHWEIDIVMDFENWNFNRPEVEQAAQFTAATTAEHVAKFGDPNAPETPASPGDALLGKPAPAFELSAMDGTPFVLADEMTDSILVLDFWATWCGPCRAAMPILEKVTKEFADQGVRLYAVNLEEEPAQITTFLEQNGIDVSVLLDKNSAVAAAYHVDGIPQTVIIGRDGTVQAVHVGVSPNLEDQLRSELTALVQGETLAGTD